MPALPSFRLDLTVWALRRRPYPDNSVDTWDGRTYRRALEVEGGTIQLAECTLRVPMGEPSARRRPLRKPPPPARTFRRSFGT